MININEEMRSILDHTQNRAANQHYCGGGAEMDRLVELGLMRYVGKKSFCPDEFYAITSKGREFLKKDA